jgi:hypothetical protein
MMLPRSYIRKSNMKQLVLSAHELFDKFMRFARIYTRIGPLRPLVWVVVLFRSNKKTDVHNLDGIIAFV